LRQRNDTFAVEAQSAPWGGPKAMKAIHSESTVAELMRSSPRAGRAFLRRRMACVGCAMAPFDTLGEAAAVYGIDLGAFVAEVERSTRAPVPRRLAGDGDD
jgi:hybrid cluster-associated redox disulfide protein